MVKDKITKRGPFMQAGIATLIGLLVVLIIIIILFGGVWGYQSYYENEINAAKSAADAAKNASQAAQSAIDAAKNLQKLIGGDNNNE